MADNLPLYGVCCYMDELVHRAPTVLQGSSKLNAPLQRYLVAAPRCYCFLTHYPFFSLHFKVSLLPVLWRLFSLPGTSIPYFEELLEIDVPMSAFACL